MQLNPFSGFIFLCGGVLLFIAVFSWNRRAVIGARAFSLSTFFQCVYVFGYAFELSSLDLSSMLLWNKFQYIGLAGFPVLYFAFVLQFTGKGAWLRTRNLILLYVVPVIFLIMKLWDDQLHLIYSSVSVDVSGPIPLLQFSRGPFYWVASLYILLILCFGLVVLMRARRHASELFKKQATLIIFAALTPMFVFIIYLSGLASIPFVKNLDLSPFALSVWGGGVSWALFRYRLFDLAPIARESLVENLEDGVVVLDRLCRIVDANPAAREIFNWKEIPVGQPSEKVFKEWETLSVLCNTSEKDVDADPPKREISHERANRLAYYDVSMIPLKNKSGNRIGNLLVIHDITHRKQVEATLHELSLADEMTGLHNRRGFNLLAAQMMSMARRMNMNVLLFFADLDGLKTINDSFGHQVGDQALIETSQILRNLFRSSDLIARLGGDEFVVMAVETGEKSVETIQSRMENLLIEINNKPSRQYHLSISVGFAVLSPNSSQSLEELLKEADQAMYRQKQAKKQASYSI